MKGKSCLRIGTVLFVLLPAAHFVRWSWGNSWSGWGEVTAHVQDHLIAVDDPRVIASATWSSVNGQRRSGNSANVIKPTRS